MPARKVIEADDEYPAGDRWEAIAWRVPEIEAYPEGVKYSFQYLAPDDTELLRYDNANDAHGVGRHHRHRNDTVEGIDFDDLRAHLAEFLNEVEIIHEQAFA